MRAAVARRSGSSSATDRTLLTGSLGGWRACTSVRTRSLVASVWRRAMVYLGLQDDEEYGYDGYADSGYGAQGYDDGYGSAAAPDQAYTDQHPETRGPTPPIGTCRAVRGPRR